MSAEPQQKHSADEWEPMVILPNLDVRGVIECRYAAVVAPSDDRVLRLGDAHPELTTFINKFVSQFREQIFPALLLVRADAPASYRTAEAICAFRDLFALSVVPYARTSRIRFRRSEHLAFTNRFQFYPWMLTANYQGITARTPSYSDVNLLSGFEGQSFPEQPQNTIMEVDIDLPLARHLLERWSVRFSTEQAAWGDRALFRSLNMANAAGSVPANTAMTFYDVGRSLALWVSAYEILAHPGGNGRSGFSTVTAELEKVKWRNSRLADKVYTIDGKSAQRVQLAAWVCNKVYDLRNDFLHGNDVGASDLLLNGQAVIDYAACLYRLELTGFLDLHFDQAAPDPQDTEATAAHVADRLRFDRFQEAYENALLSAA
jgi:hypothetical protein